MTEILPRSAGFPTTPLIFAAALIGSALAVASGARISGVGTTHLTYNRTVESRDLQFQDVPNGAILIKDAGSGKVIGEIMPGNDGFVRMVMRLLARERIGAGIGQTVPFTLARWDNGRLTIADPATGHRMELVGFGASNVEAFAKLLTDGSASP
jgi:putative photosynthetic complex assembly protein